MAIIVGCDFHSSYQRIAFLDTERGEIEERSLTQSGAEVEQFYSIGGWAGPRQIWRQQKTDRRDAGHTLKLLIESCFPRICTPTVEKRDHRQLLIHRYRLVQLRTRVKNELQHLALNQGLQWKRKL